MRRTIEIRAFVGDVKAGLSDGQLIQKYEVSARELTSLMLQAADMDLINPSELCSVGKDNHPSVQLGDSRAVPRVYIESGLSIYELHERVQADVLDISEQGIRVKGIRVGATETKHFEIVACWCSPPYAVDLLAKCRWTEPAEVQGNCTAGFEIVSIKTGSLRRLCEDLSRLPGTSNSGYVGHLGKFLTRIEKSAEPTVNGNLMTRELEPRASKIAHGECFCEEGLESNAMARGSTQRPRERPRGNQMHAGEGSAAKILPMKASSSTGAVQYGFARSALRYVACACEAEEAERAIEGFRSNQMVQESDWRSKAMRDLLQKCWMAAQSDSTVLLKGETGSGKDFMAEYIHRISKRATAPFQSFNCSAIPSDLAESELFGHEAGAFTGAKSRKKGLVAQAPGGTLLLNEVGDLPSIVQAKLLTFLDTKRFWPVGGRAEMGVDVRILAATNKDLEEEVAKGGFRQDLYYRLNVLPISVPALREIIEELPVLIRNLAARLARQLGMNHVVAVDKKTLALLQGYDWPGNIRELCNRIERSLVLSGGRKISFSLMFDDSANDKWPVNMEFGPPMNFNEFIRETRRYLVLEALKRSQGNRQMAAKLLGITRYSLKRQMTTLGLMCE